MTFAWYAHLKNLSGRAWYVAALVSWGIALFEYLLQVPANRIGHTVLTLPQLKIVQEVISLAVFVPFVLLTSSEWQPAAVSIYSFFGQYGAIAYGRLAAFSILYSLPVRMLYVLVTRVFGGGFAMSGAVKG